MQREVVALSATLPPLTESQKRWAEEHVCHPKAFKCKKEVWCSCCGKVFPFISSDLAITLEVEDKVICPGCGRKLKVEVNRRKKHTEACYYTVITRCGCYQVCRHFIVDRWIDKGGKPGVFIHEAVQNWISPEGHEEVIARPVKAWPGVYDAWDFCKPMELRNKNNGRSGGYYRPDKYKISGSWIYPHPRLLPEVRRNGFHLGFGGIPASELIKLLLTDREAEAMAKNKQFGLIGYKWRRGIREGCMPFAHSIRIARRNKYRIKDASMWFDYLDLLAYFNLDTHNAHYVCPRRLKAAHDRLQKRKEAREAKKRAEEKRREAALWEKQYQKDKGKYFGICFGDEEVTIAVITSVADMAEEGAAMHHCVYTARYFNKPESLILSARDSSGKRLETVEVNLKTFQVVQSRAKCNETTAYHDRILNLIDRNIHLIRQAS